jgi:hypothetical protein
MGGVGAASLGAALARVIGGFSLACAMALGALCASSPVSAAAQGESRVALVIGNASYPESPLKNPVNDARAMALTLRALGFETIVRENASYREMRRAVGEFGRRIACGGVGLFYFAGHGVQVRGRNYLMPVDAEIGTEAEVALESLDLATVLEQMAAAGNRVNIAILDACRNNPFERRFRSAGGGLASVDAPKGTLIAFATAPGKVAADGAGANGLYTSELLKAIRQPGVRLEDVFKQVRVEVTRQTRDEQTPWETSSLTGDFYFTPAAAAAAPATGAAPPGRPAADAPGSADNAAIELAFWNAIKDSRDAGDYREYLKQFPKGRFAGLANNRLAALEAAPAAEPPAAVDRLSAAYRAVRAGNVRSRPHQQATPIGKLSPDDSVAVTGRVRGSDWLQVALADGQTGYVASFLVEPEQVWQRRRTPGAADPPAPAPVEMPKAVAAPDPRPAQAEQAAAAPRPREGLARFDGVWRGHTYTCIVGTPNPVEVTISNGVMTGIYERPLGPPRELTGRVDAQGRVKGTGVDAEFEGTIVDDKLTGNFESFNIPVIKQCRSSFHLTRK